MRVIRAAHPDDWLDEPRIHVLGWQHAYRGAMSDEFLDGLVPEEWSGWRRRRRVGKFRVCDISFLAVEGDVVGYVDVGPDWDDEDISGRLYAIYVDPDRIGEGFGRVLIDAGRQALFQLGHQRANLWVLNSNERARRFYEADGWTTNGSEQSEEFGGGVVDEVRYVRDLESPNDV